MKSERNRFILGVFLIIVGVVLIFCGFYTPPVGEIHSSVLGAVGELLTVGGALLGIDVYFDHKMRKILANKEENTENTENYD